MEIKAIKTEKELIDGLELYLKTGYIDPNYINNDSFDEGAEQATEYLESLSSINHILAEEYYKRIIEADTIWNDFFKALCLSTLLLSDTARRYAYDYLSKNSNHLSIPALKEAMFYFYCAKNDPNPHDIPEDLPKKLKKRYEELKDDEEAEFFNLEQEYDNFARAYNLI